METENSEPTAVPPTTDAEARPSEPAAIENKDEDAIEGEGNAEGDAPKSEAPEFNFVFEEEKKKKKKSKKSKKDKKGQKSFNREYYESLITTLNNQLGDLRKIFSRKDEVNSKLAHELANIEEDRLDVCEHLERTLNKREIQIVELEQTLVKLEQEYAEYKDTSSQRIVELQKLIVTTEKQLSSEIELQKRALSSLNEFRLKRDAVLARYQTTHDLVENMDRQCKEDLFNLEQKNTVQKNVLKKEVKLRLQQVAEDFQHSSEIRNAGYTRNLIRENITLHKTLDRRVKQNISIMEEREKQFLKTKEVMESYASMEQFTEHLANTIENKNAIIKRLTGRIDRMKTAYVDSRRYRNLYDKAKEKGMLKRTPPQNLSNMHAHLEKLRTEKFTLHWMIYEQEPEIERLRQVLDKLMSAVMMAVHTLHPETDKSLTETDIEELHHVLRQNIVAELIPIVSGTTPGTEECSEQNEAHEAAVYRPGLCGFIPSKHNRTEETLTQLHPSTKSFKGEIASKASTSLYGLDFGSYCYYSHTPTIRSSSMLSPIEECNSELHNDASSVSSIEANAVGRKYRRKRCSCPKKKHSTALESVSKLIFMEPKKMLTQEISGAKCIQPLSVNCPDLDYSLYCSDSTSQDDKMLRSANVSFQHQNESKNRSCKC